MRTLVVVSFLILNYVFAHGQGKKYISKSEIKDIIRLTIDLTELQQYYHVDIDSSRIPLIIKEFGSINSENIIGLQKFGQQVQVLNEQTIIEKRIKAYLNISDWTYDGNNVRLQADYEIEGIKINIRLNRINDHWKIVDSLIVEE